MAKKRNVVSALYLMPREIEKLTGHSDFDNQRRWLRDHGVQHYMSANRFPMVGRSVVSLMRHLLVIEEVPALDRLFAGEPIGSVYIVDEGTDDSAVKIGWSGRNDGCVARLMSLQIGNPRRLRLLFEAPGTYDIEQFIHRQIGAWRLNGEWFERSPEVRQFVSACIGYGFRTALEKIMPNPLAVAA